MEYVLSNDRRCCNEDSIRLKGEFMKVWNYELTSMKKYRVRLKDDYKKSTLKSPVGVMRKGYPIEVSDISHFNDLVNFMPYLVIETWDNNGFWKIVHPVSAEKSLDAGAKKSGKKGLLRETSIEDIENIKIRGK